MRNVKKQRKGRLDIILLQPGRKTAAESLDLAVKAYLPVKYIFK